MKKLKGFKTEHLRNVVLYLDDLEKIVEVFKEVSNDVNITIGSYVLDNLNEIETLEEDFFNSVSIISYKPSVTLSIDKEKVFLGEYKGSLETRGFFEKVKQILYERRRKLSWFFQSFWFIPVLLFLSIFLINSSRLSDNFLLGFIGIIMMITVIVWIGGQIRWFNKNKIYTRRKREFPSFWKRRKDDIILIVISALVGAIITFMVMKIFK